MAKKATGYPWDRLDGEGEKPYQAFVMYRDMGLERTYQAVADGLQKSYTLIRRWKDKFDWEQRALAYDNHLQKEALKTAKKQTREMNERHIKIAIKMQEVAFEALEQLDISDMSAKDIKELFKTATDLERLTRQNAIGDLEEKETETGADRETVHIYLPDNGRLEQGGDADATDH